jgi:hypothetical protein
VQSDEPTEGGRIDRGVERVPTVAGLEDDLPLLLTIDEPEPAVGEVAIVVGAPVTPRRTAT